MNAIDHSGFPFEELTDSELEAVTGAPNEGNTALSPPNVLICGAMVPTMNATAFHGLLKHEKAFAIKSNML